MPVNESKDIYSENFQTLTKEIKEDTGKIESHSMIMNSKNKFCGKYILTKTIYRFNPIPIKTPMSLFTNKQNQPQNIFI